MYALLPPAYFGFGTFKNISKQHHLPAVLTTYKVLLPFLLLAAGLLAFYLKTTQTSLRKAAAMVTVFLWVNLVVETGWFGYNAATNAGLKQDFGDPYHVLIKNYTPKDSRYQRSGSWYNFIFL